MLLSFTGRKTGRTYQQPVSYVRDGAVLLTPGGGRWKLNLREDQPIHIRLGGRDVRARPEFNPRVRSFVPVVGPHGDIDHGKLQTAISYGLCIIRWHLDPTDPAGP
jgi:hypothetical protein